MSAHVSPRAQPGGYTQEIDPEWDPNAAPGAVVTRDSDGMITDVDLDAADRYAAAKGFAAAGAAPGAAANDYADGYAD